MKAFKVFGAVLMVTFLFFPFPVFGEEIRFVPTFRANWPHVDRPNLYDYAASGMVEDNFWKVWFCGEDKKPGRITGDSVFYWILSPSGEGSLKENPVLPNSQSDSAQDGRHSCAPSVFKHANPYIQGGQELYKIYYECTPRFYDKQTGELVEGFTQICHAVSEDGENWQKFNRQLWEAQHRYGDLNTPPTPVITVSSQILTNCQYEFSQGKHKISGNCLNDPANYGVGHPSVIVKEINGGQQIWLWYYDSKGNWAQRRVFLTKSWDGFNFENPIPTNLTNPVEVRYFSSGSFFVATQGLENDNYFAYSFDGINWVWYETVENKNRLKIGKAVSTNQIAFAQPAILGNKFGISQTFFVNILSGEGPPAENWWENSGLWLIQGKFLGMKFLLNACYNKNLEGDLNSDGKINAFDFGVVNSFSFTTKSPGQ
jgi:hypothetical protein